MSKREQAASRRSEKLWFLHSLRAVAALLVIISHWGYNFWAENEGTNESAKTLHLDFTGESLPHLNVLAWMARHQLDAGELGVALFFLISGFVIPMSIESVGSWKFLFRRVFRIYPTYLVGLLITFSVVWGYRHYVQLPFPYTALDYWKNASLFRDVFGGPSIDGINWTLELEVKFYLLCALMFAIASFSLRSSSILTLLTGLACLATVRIHTMEGPIPADLERPYYLLSFWSVFLTFMFIGTCFYNLYKKRWSLDQFLLTALLLGGFFLVNVRFGLGRDQLLPFGLNYMLALLIFSLCYAFQKRLPYSKTLDFLANLSYPIYMVHAVSGYVLLTVLYQLHPYPYLNLLEVAALALIVSYLLHKFVELPSNQLGRALTSRKKKPSEHAGSPAGH